MGKLILVLGGARSGKSSFAEEIVTDLGGLEVTYIATSQARDQEMEERIKQHQETRPQEWATIEENKEVSQVMQGIDTGSVVLLDCLTVLISNLLLQEEELATEDYDFNGQAREEDILLEVDNIIGQVKERDLTLVIVSNEVGQGLVPPYKLGRVYRDIVGRANQLVADKADEVYVTYAGLPINIKELSLKTKEKLFK
ncbi:bifunctional adenosylcobinamide kinase/adenosylcobinamide-phosphate guanylyltransferase [Halanaerocella petrolearia]